MKAYNVQCNIYQAYSIHLAYCEKRNITPKTLDQFRKLMAA